MTFKATLSLALAGAFALALGGCGMMGSSNEGPASAGSVGGYGTEAQGGAAGAGTQGGPSGGVGTTPGS
ncbi:hypothetical protein [Acidisoma cladoniae]|jgi:hypothetical protein|uniref:hypothetical protein n=1 Tax=Acidisoma cladoniae TaxID=3040935 RepID=UPI002549DEFD|nr:hypothetical protein [Acidisoma sp. PAMC 29798]